MNLTEHQSSCCRKCGKTKAFSDFYRKGSGVQPWCKECYKAYINARRNRTEIPAEDRVTEKRCRTCQEVKPARSFWEKKSTRDGLDHECKSCQAKRLKAYWGKHPDKLAEKRTKLLKKYRINYPERAEANKIYQRALLNGVIKREPCRVCGDPKTEGHHPDYSHPIDVVWLCRQHHREVHVLARELEKAR